MGTRHPAVAGTFYPGDPSLLAADVGRMLADAGQRLAARAPTELPAGPPKAVLVPHAGYIYSGSTAALAFALLARHRGTLRRVVLLGPVHRVPVLGLALDGATQYLTPLGPIRIDPGMAEQVAALPQVVHEPAANAWEHSLEVQLPFLQAALGDFTLVPFAVGEAGAAEVAGVLDAVWGGPETVVVISSDLSHYLPYDSAVQRDSLTMERILALDPTLPHDRACGVTPLNGLLVAAARHGLTPHLLGMCNSGDTAGDRDRVVGYAAVGFWGRATATEAGK